MPLSPIAKACARIVHQWAQEYYSTPILHDERLQRTADTIAMDLISAASRGVPPQTPSIDLQRAKQRAYDLGWTDGQLGAVAITIRHAQNHQPQPDADLTQRLTHDLTGLAPADFNRVGVGMAIDAQAQSTWIVLLFSRRMLTLSPFPKHVQPGEYLTLSGHLNAQVPSQTRQKTIALHVGYPDGTITQHTVPVKTHGQFLYRLHVPSIQGSMDVQFLIDHGHGPQIAAQFPISVDGSASATIVNEQSTASNVTPAQTVAPTITPDQHDAKTSPPSPDVAQTLFTLISTARHDQGLQPVTEHPMLQDAAATHAQEMRDHNYFAHRSPTTGTVADRLRTRRISYVSVFENIAVGADATSIMQAWMESPAHRANILAPNVDMIGIGISTPDTTQHPPHMYVSLVLAQQPNTDSPQQLANRAVDMINAARRAQKLQPLRRDSSLDTIALQHSTAMADQGRLVDHDAHGSTAADIALRTTSATHAAADIYLVNSLEPLTHSAHSVGPYQRIGIGIVRDTQRTGPQLWITVVVAATLGASAAEE